MSKKLVAYFSIGGKTAEIAKKLAEAAGADLYEIKPKVPYAEEDLNWKNKHARSTIEMKDRKSRPLIADKDADIPAYDVIFVGFPIWWFIAPTIINTFLESYDFSGKTIVPFATSGGNKFGRTMYRLRPSVSNMATWKKGKMLNDNPSKDTLADWVKSLDLL